MKTVKFRTNLKCNGCIKMITPNMDKIEGISVWGVDLEHEDNLLKVQGEGFDELEVVNALEEVGYKAESVS